MQDVEVINILQNHLSFSSKNISDLKIFKNELLRANIKHNLISKSTEINIWQRHILDSAQIIKFIDESKDNNIVKAITEIAHEHGIKVAISVGGQTAQSSDWKLPRSPEATANALSKFMADQGVDSVGFDAEDDDTELRLGLSFKF